MADPTRTPAPGRAFTAQPAPDRPPPRVKASGTGGRLVLLLRDVLVPAEAFSACTRALGPSYRVAWYDPAGLGEGPPLPTDNPAPLDLWATEAELVLRRLGARAHLVGVGIGGAIAVAVAARSPQLVASATAIGTGASGASALERQVYGRIARWAPWVGMVALRPWLARQVFDPVAHGDPRRHADRQACRARLGSEGRGIVAAAQAAMYRGPLDAMAVAVRRPTAILRGEHDRMTPFADAHRLAELIPRASLHEIRHAGRAAPVDEPEAVAEAIRPTLEAGAGATPAPTPAPSPTIRPRPRR